MTKYMKFIEAYSRTREWVRDSGWRSIRIRALPRWVPFVGIYLPFLRLILVQPEGHDGDEDCMEFATCVHELRHAYQRHKLGLAGYMLLKAFHRADLEADAEAAEMDAVCWFTANRLSAGEEK